MLHPITPARPHNVLGRLLLLTALLANSACQSSSSSTTTTTAAGSMGELPSVRVAQEATATAQVLAMSPAERRATLRTESGRMLEVTASDAVRNFERIRVGDTLRVRYQSAMVASLLGADAVMQGAEATLVGARSREGATPGAGIAIAASLRVRIESIDLAHDIVVFAVASGELIAHRIASEDGRQFVQQLKVGSLVQLDYGEALAIGIEPVGR